VPTFFLPWGRKDFAPVHIVPHHVAVGVSRSEMHLAGVEETADALLPQPPAHALLVQVVRRCLPEKGAGLNRKRRPSCSTNSSDDRW